MCVCVSHRVCMRDFTSLHRCEMYTFVGQTHTHYVLPHTHCVLFLSHTPTHYCCVSVFLSNAFLSFGAGNNEGIRGTLTHCNPLQPTATRCNTLQHAAAHCNVWQHTATLQLQHSAVIRDNNTTNCNTLQLTTTHCNTLQRTATYGHALQHSNYNNTPTSTLCSNTTQQYNPLQHTVAHCTTLQHTAVHGIPNTPSATHPV